MMHGSPVTAARAAGAFTLIHGVVFVVHWVSPISWLAALLPTANLLGLVSPLLFVAVSLCFWGACATASSPAPAPRRRRATIAGALLLIAVALLAGIAFGSPLGPDALPRTQVPGRPPPFRLSPNGSLAFLLTGAAFLLFARPLVSWRRRAFVACTLLVAFIGLAGIVGHMLGLEVLYRLPTFNRILPPTAVALVVVGIGLWALHEAVQAPPLHQIEGRIARRTVAVIALVALGCGVAGFAVMRENFVASIERNLQLTASTTATSLAHTIDAGLQFPRTISSRIAVAEALAVLADHPADPAAREFVQRVANNIVGAPLNSAEFRLVSGAPVAAAGTSQRASVVLVHPLQGVTPRAMLGWNDGYVLLAENSIHHKGRLVGQVFTEQRLPLFDELLANVRAANESSDAAVCSIDEGRALCAPTRFRRGVFSIPLHDAAGRPSYPVVRALQGQTGVQFTKDPRGIDVVSAHTPIGAYGLGLAVKTDVSTLYVPLRSRLTLLSASVAAIIALAIVALRSQVRPVVGRLAESERSVKAMIEEQSELVSLARPGGELVYVNAAYAHHFGMRPEDLVGQNLLDHVDAADREAVAAAIAAVLESGRTVNHENRTVSDGDRTVRWVAWTNSRQSNAQGQPLLQSVGRDVTERKQAELALRESQAMLARTGEIARVGGWELDLRTNELLWSDETRRLHEVGPELVPSLDAALAFHPGPARLAMAAAVEAAARAGTPWDLELPLVTATGRRIWTRSQGQAVSEDGQRVRLVGAVQDITERKELQERLAAGERLIRGVADGVPALVAHIDRERRYTFANAQLGRTLGLDPAAMIGRTVRELNPEVDDAVLGPHLDAALRGDARTFEATVVADGRTTHYRTSYTPDVAPDGEVRGCFSMTVDVTAIREAEQAAQQARRAADAVAEDLRLLFDAMPAALSLWSADGTLLMFNRHFAALHVHNGEPPQEGSSIEAMLRLAVARGRVPEASGREDAWIAQRLRQFAQPGESSIRAQASGGSRRLLEVKLPDGRVLGHSVDVTELVTAQAEAATARQRLHEAIEALPAGFELYDADDRLIMVNSTMKALYPRVADLLGQGLTFEHLVRENWSRGGLIVPDDDIERWIAERRRQRRMGGSRTQQLADGRWVRSFDRSTQEGGVVGVRIDITELIERDRELARLNEELQRTADTDPLTLLANRRLFERRLADAFASAREHGGSIALALFDIDYFKRYNDCHGHPAGDACLRRVAALLTAAVRGPDDLVARLGGEEFAILLPGEDEEGVSAVAQRCMDLLRDAAIAHGDSPLGPHVSVSAGIAVLQPDEGVEQLIARADAALYAAKVAGRARWQLARVSH
jgi:diguanylate cyclase (GGDEF)-like protein/PAS domain S-box-containing protein